MDLMGWDRQTDSSGSVGGPIPGILALGVSVASSIVLAEYFKGIVTSPGWMRDRLAIITLLGANSTLFLILGYISIQGQTRVLHKRRVLTATLLSTVFLAGFLAYQHFHSETAVPGKGATVTNISIPAATGGGIKAVLPERFGINLDDSYYYGNNQLTANLIASNNLNFAPQIWAASSFCASGTTTTWVDNDTSSIQPANFWQGATYQIISGVNAGATGTITSSTNSSGAQTLNLSGTLASGCNSGYGGDVMLLRCRTPYGTCAGGLVPTGSTLPGITLTGGASLAFETSDVSPSSSATQALEMIAPGSATAQFAPAYDATLGGKVYINLNGTYTLTFRAKGTAGAPTVSYYVGRAAANLNSSVTPTVNSTPGAGWTNYSFSFTASETGSQTQTGQVKITATGGTVLMQDVALTESPTGGNPTVFRNAVYQRLLNLHPGMIRYSTGNQFGCTFDNLIQNYSGRARCGTETYSPYAGAYGGSGGGIAFGLNDILLLDAAVGADPWWTFSAYATQADMSNIAAYFNAPCSSGNSYATIRCNFLAGTPFAGMTWPQALAVNGSGNIFLEMGNKVWNCGMPDSMCTAAGGYGSIFGANVAAMRAAPYYSSKIKMVGSGFIEEPTSGGWNDQVLTAAVAVTNGKPDYIDGAPYTFSFMTDTSSNANIFGPMFAEPVNAVSNISQQPGAPMTANTYLLQNHSYTAYGVNGAIYESNITANCGIAGVSQGTINGITAGLGGGLDATLNLLLSARDAGVLLGNIFALPEATNEFFTAASTTAGNCGANGAPLYQPGGGQTSLCRGRRTQAPSTGLRG